MKDEINKPGPDSPLNATPQHGCPVAGSFKAWAAKPATRLCSKKTFT
jgi:hypothetical protein